MKPLEYQEEWLSAYLDDELTEEQRQIVASRLASDPGALATLEDLKRVRKLVSELSPWSGQDLHVNIASLATTTVVGVDNHDSFDDVPQSLGTAGELRSVPKNLEAWTSKPVRRFPIVWAATAASILLLLGLGSAARLQWGKLDLALSDAVTPATAAKEAFNGNAGTPKSQLAERASALLVESNVNSELATRNELAVVPGGGREQPSQQDFAYRTFDAPALPADPAELASPGPASALAVANVQDQPQATGNTPTATASAPLAENASATANFGKLYALGAGIELQLNVPSEIERVRVARSSAWSEAEVQAAFAETLPSLGIPGIPSQDERVANEMRYAGTAEGSPISAMSRPAAMSTSQQPLLLAALEPRLANSSVLFDDLVDGNQLATITLSPSPQAKSSANSIEDVAMDKDVEAAKEQDTRKQDPKEQDSEKSNKKISANSQFFRQQPGTHSIPDSIVLFLSESEAKQVLEQLQQKGLVASQIWQVTSEAQADWYTSQNPTEESEQVGSRGGVGGLPSTNEESLSRRSIAAEKQPSSPTNLPETELAELKQKSDVSASELSGRRVILLLSSPTR